MGILRGMVSLVSGLSGESYPKFILGYTSDETVMLDLDDMTLKDVLYWSRRALRRFSLGGFLVLESSSGCFHVVFDRRVDWCENMRIVAWVALLSKKMKLRRWLSTALSITACLILGM